MTVLGKKATFSLVTKSAKPSSAKSLIYQGKKAFFGSLYFAKPSGLLRGVRICCFREQILMRCAYAPGAKICQHPYAEIFPQIYRIGWKGCPLSAEQKAATVFG